MNVEEGGAIRREDYQPYPWVVESAELRFDLAHDDTRVTAELAVRRNASCEPSEDIELHGFDLELIKGQLL